MRSPEFPNLKEIYVLRKKLGWTQHQLAKCAGVDRGTIAQLETERIKSAKYTTLSRIFNCLYKYKKHNLEPLYKISVKKIVYLSPHDNLQKAWDIMLQKNFDVIPILERGMLKGKITIEGIHNYKRKKPFSKTKIYEALEESPPTIPYNTQTYWVEKFLSTRCDCVLLTKNGKFVGIVTPFDLKFKK
jgi:predicted transcriptional regulator